MLAKFRSHTGPGGRLIAIALSIVIVAACAPRPTTAEATAADDYVISSSPLGLYLAGVHAERTKDLSAAADFLLETLKSDPDNPSLLLESYLLLVSEGRIDEALPLAERVIEYDPQSPHAWLTLAVAAVKAGNIEAADGYLAKIPLEGVNRVIVPLVHAWTTLEVAGIDEAVAQLDALRALGGAEPLREMHLGLLNDVGGDIVAAKSVYDGLAIDPSILSLREVQIIGNFRQRQGDDAGARQLYDEYVAATGATLAIEPAYAALDDGKSVAPIAGDVAEGMAEALFDVAFLLERQQARDTALVLTRKALYLKPEFAIARIFLADSLASDERFEEAVEAYHAVPAGSGFDWQARLEIARILDRLDRTDEAAELLEGMLDERPERSDAAQLLGTLLRGRDRFAEAAPFYDIAVDRIDQPTANDWPLFYFRGIVRERTQQWEGAEADFLKALELEPNQPYVMNYLAYSWIEFGENYDQALDMLTRAVELRPEDGYIVDSLGWIYYRLGNYAKAVEYLERAIELSPIDPTINDHLGDAYWRVGRLNEARFQWRRALNFNPEAELLSAIEGKLERGLVDGGSAESQTGG
jgi:tetratricopeptide (TPR) repeat protein